MLADAISCGETPSVDLEDATLFFLRGLIDNRVWQHGQNGIFSFSTQSQSQELEKRQRCSSPSVTLGLKTTKGVMNTCGVLPPSLGMTPKMQMWGYSGPVSTMIL